MFLTSGCGRSGLEEAEARAVGFWVLPVAGELGALELACQVCPRLPATVELAQEVARVVVDDGTGRGDHGLCAGEEERVGEADSFSGRLLRRAAGVTGGEHDPSRHR